MVKPCFILFSRKPRLKGQILGKGKGGDQIELLKEFDATMNAESAMHRPKEKGFFDSVKQFFDDLKG